MLLLPVDPFSGLEILRARYNAGRQPSEDVPGWALSWQLTRKDEFAQHAVAELKKMLPLREGTSRSYTKFVGVALAFDWLYEHPAFESALKDQIADELLSATETLLKGPDLRTPEQSSYHNYVLRYLAIVAFSIAAVRSHPKTTARCAGWQLSRVYGLFPDYARADGDACGAGTHDDRE
jgi:hypothetical protein